MKISGIVFCFILSFVGFAGADVYVLYNTSSKEIASIQDDDSAVLEQGFTKKIIEGKKIADFGLDQNAVDYKFVNDKFVLNSKKISDRENEKEAGEAKEVKRKTDLGSAKVKLMALGLTEDEFESLRN